MRRPRPAVLAGLLLAVLAAVLAWRSLGGAEQLRYYSPDAYVARADRFIADGWLVADCSGPEPRLVPRLEAAPPAEAEWYRDSYLAADVERFNAEPESFGWAFSLDPDCTLRGVDPSVHRIELPFARRARWLGRILYGGGADDAVLRSPRRTVGLRRPDRPVAARDTAPTPVGGDETLVGEGVVLFHFGSAERPAARVWHVGDEVVVFNRVRPELDDAVRLMGYRLQEGRRARLETGDWLDLTGRARGARRPSSTSAARPGRRRAWCAGATTAASGSPRTWGSGGCPTRCSRAATRCSTCWSTASTPRSPRCPRRGPRSCRRASTSRSPSTARSRSPSPGASPPPPRRRGTGRRRSPPG